MRLAGHGLCWLVWCLRSCWNFLHGLWRWLRLKASVTAIKSLSANSCPKNIQWTLPNRRIHTLLSFLKHVLRYCISKDRNPRWTIKVENASDIIKRLLFRLLLDSALWFQLTVYHTRWHCTHMWEKCLKPLLLYFETIGWVSWVE